ncbi:MAG: hypothetical protein WC613_04160 [Candidatus Aenigmatarchaeota archaeon]
MGFASRLKTMKIQSATNIAISSMKHLKVFSVKNGFGNKFEAECTKLTAARPTAVILHNAIERIKKEKSRKNIDRIINDLAEAKEKAAENAAKIFSKRKVVLTHCHSTSVIAALVKNKSNVKEVIVTETRPRDQGVITAKELLAKKIKVSFIVDSAISDFIGKCDMVLVGADALRKEGLINKVGTHPLAVVAKENRKPFYVVTSTFSIDKRKRILMEERPVSEMAHKNLKGAKIYNPAFDLTPWKYVTGVITERGISKNPRKLIK